MNSPTYLPGIEQIPRRHDKLKKASNGTALFFAVLVAAIFPLWRTLNFIPQPPISLYYGAFGILSVMAILTGSHRLQWSTVWLLGWCAASILLNTFSAYFTPWPRLLSLTLIIIAVGPMFANHKLMVWRQKSLNVILWGCVLIATISFVLYYVARSITMFRGILFQGITSNSMTISPIAFIGSLFLIEKFFNASKEYKLRKKIGIWILIAICIFTGILAGSRSALLSLLISFVIWLWIYLKSFKKYLIVLFSIGFVIIITAPAWTNYTETIDKKIEASQAAGSLLSTRENIWKQRWKEFQKEPIFGIGFSKVDRDSEGEDLTKSKTGTGIVEPGNGWLFVLSSTGIGGFIFLLWIYLKMLWKLIRIHSTEALLIASLLIFLGVHSFAEGYIFASGSFFCLVFWLCLGLAASMPKPQLNYRQLHEARI